MNDTATRLWDDGADEEWVVCWRAAMKAAQDMIKKSEDPFVTLDAIDRVDNLLMSATGRGWLWEENRV